MLNDVRAVGEHAAVAEEQRLDQQRDAHGDHRGPRPEQHRDQHAPTACAVVPSGIGTLNIITRKLYAAPIASSGT